MKKLLVMISAFVLTTVSTNQLVESMISTNILKPIIKNKTQKLNEFNQINDKELIDFNKVENYFKDEKNKTNNKFNGISSSVLQNESAIDKAFTRGLEYTREFKAKNMSLNQIITKFQNEIPKFKTVFERELNKQPKTNAFNFKSIYKKTSPKFNNNEDEKKLKLEAAEFWNQLNNIKNVLATSVAIAAITAAGFWALAWLGGISIPWAVAATSATVAMGVMLSSLNIYLSSSNPYMNKITQGISITANAGLLVYEFISDVIKVFTVGTITLSATSIIMPAFTAVSAVVVSLYYWFNSTDIFKQLDTNEKFNDNINEINNSNPKYIFNYTLAHKKDIATGGDISKYTNQEVKIIDWTKYSDSWNEFKKNIKGLNLLNSKAFAGDSEDFKEAKNIVIPMHELISGREHNILDQIYDPLIGCREHDRLSHISRVEDNYIISKFYFSIETTCWQTNYVKLAYEGVGVIL